MEEMDQIEESLRAARHSVAANVRRNHDEIAELETRMAWVKVHIQEGENVLSRLDDTIAVLQGFDPLHPPQSEVPDDSDEPKGKWRFNGTGSPLTCLLCGALVTHRPTDQDAHMGFHARTPSLRRFLT